VPIAVKTVAPNNPRRYKTMDTHLRYEYVTREVSTSPETTFNDDPGLVAAGFSRVWADITTGGTFIVYRRERVSIRGGNP
jgi:hypothetical protein